MTPGNNFEHLIELFGLTVDADHEAEDPTKLADAEQEIEDKRPLSAMEKGEIHMRAGQFEKAVEQFKAAVAETGGTSPDALMNLAASLEASDAIPQAMHQYRKALKLQQEASEPHVGLSDIYRRYGRGQDALRELEAAIEAEPENPYLHYRMAEALRALSLPSKALEAVARAIVLAPDQSFYHYWNADVQIQLKRYDEALDSLRAAIELSPGDDHLYVRTAVAFWGAGRQVEAIKAAQLAGDLNPDRKAINGVLAAFLHAAKRKEDYDQMRNKLDQMDDFDRDWANRQLADVGLSV